MSTELSEGRRLPGWGIAADVENDPTYPMRDRRQDDGPGMHWRRPPQQQPDVEVLISVEHKHLPAVFGTASPPSGLSGLLRRQAFKHSESKWSHWLMLLAADRINVVEGVLGDLGRGRLPNVFAESGFGAQWRYNRPAAVRRVAFTGIVLGAVGVAAFAMMRKRR